MAITFRKRQKTESRLTLWLLSFFGISACVGFVVTPRTVKRVTLTTSLRSRNGTTQSSTDFETFLAEDVQKQYRELQKEESDQATLFQAPTTLAFEEAETAGGPSDKDVTLARLLLIGAAALYGTNFSLVKMLGQTDIPIGLSSTLRFGMAALALAPFLFGKSKEDTNTLVESNFSPEVGATLAGLEVGMWNSIGYVAQAVGLETTLASKSAFLCSLAVVTVPLIDFVAGKRLLPREMLGAMMALGGVAVLEFGGMSAADLTVTSGDIASLIQPLAFGIGFWRMEKAMHKYPNEAKRSTAAQLLAVFVGSAIYAGVTDPTSFLNLAQIQEWLSDPMILLSLFWTGVVTTALTVYMETVALKTLTAAETTLIFSTEPLWGTAFAAAVMGEHLGMDSAVGAVLILTGCLFSNLGVGGIKSLLGKKEKLEAAQGGSIAEKIPPAFKMSQLNWVQAGIAGSVASSVLLAWSNLSIGTRVFAYQVQDFLEEILPSLPEN